MKIKTLWDNLKKYYNQFSLKSGYFKTFIVWVFILILALLLISVLKDFNNKNNKIIVTGSAQKDITSDLIVWTGNFSTKSLNLKDAYNKLQNDLLKIKSFLKGKGINDDEMIIDSIVINKDYKRIKKNDEEIDLFDGFSLSQAIKIESKNIEKIEKISREITDLIQQGIEFYSSHPQYYYTNIADLKKIMVGLAAKDAFSRAQQIAENSNSRIKNLKNARMGVFQIIGKNSYENFTSGGTFNTSSKEKTVSINVHLEYNIE